MLIAGYSRSREELGRAVDILARRDSSGRT